jgi:hypothetical protein
MHLVRRSIRSWMGWLGIALVALAPSVAASNEPISPRIVNGLLTSDFPTTGSLLTGNDPDSALHWCSGTLIGCETFLTAAHCVCEFTGSDCQSGPLAPDPNEWLVFFQHAGFFTVSNIAVHLDFDFPTTDVAVITLGTPVNGISPTPINTTASPPFGSSGTIVGFGRSGGANDEYGLKQFGAVVTASCTGGIPDEQAVCWNFENPVGDPGEDSNTCNGDSGGPLFIDLGSGEVVAGVTSGGTSTDCLAPDASFDANVFTYSQWIQSQGGADLFNTTCGSFSQVGTPGVDMHGFSGTVSTGKLEGRHQLGVAAGAELLVVTMNASQAGSNDFDLYVKYGSPPTTSDYDCRAFGANQWGSCEFPFPSQGTWHVLVNHFAGGGTYQSTATVYTLAPTAPAVPALPAVGLWLLVLALLGVVGRIAPKWTHCLNRSGF